MIRLIVRRTDVAAAVNVGGPVDVLYKTFDIYHPTMEEYLSKASDGKSNYLTSLVVGAEVVKDYVINDEEVNGKT